MIRAMTDEDQNGDSFEERLRMLVGELGRFIERAVQNVGDELDQRDPHGATLRPAGEATLHPLGGAGPHPRDLPSEEQGRALAALDSGRWTIEPGTDALAAKREGPDPQGALAIARELRIRDWIGTDGRLTLAGQRALARWLDATT
jgi:hypothetical protein